MKKNQTFPRPLFAPQDQPPHIDEPLRLKRRQESGCAAASFKKAFHAVHF